MESHGVASFTVDTSIRTYKYTVAVADETLSISMEDTVTGVQWRADALTLANFVTVENAIQGYFIRDYSQHILECLSDPDDASSRSFSPSPTAAATVAGSLSVSQAFHVGTHIIPVEYKFTLVCHHRPEPEDRMRSLLSQVETVTRQHDLTKKDLAKIFQEYQERNEDLIKAKEDLAKKYKECQKRNEQLDKTAEDLVQQNNELQERNQELVTQRHDVVDGRLKVLKQNVLEKLAKHDQELQSPVPSQATQEAPVVERSRRAQRNPQLPAELTSSSVGSSASAGGGATTRWSSSLAGMPVAASSMGCVCVGIDFGSTETRMGMRLPNGSIETISIPSWVAFTPTGRLVGKAAKTQFLSNVENTVFDIKSLLGRKFMDPVVNDRKKQWLFKVVQGHLDKPMIYVSQQGCRYRVTAEDIVAMLLTALIVKANAQWGATVTSAVVAVPVYFNTAQRQAMAQAAALAGLKVVGLVNETSAAALTYNLDPTLPSRALKTVVLVDMGSGACNVSLLVAKQETILVKAATGLLNLGGGSFVELMAKRVKNRTNPRNMRRLRDAFEDAICHLSCDTDACVRLAPLGDDFSVTHSFDHASFQETCQDLIDQVVALIGTVLTDGGLSQVADEVVLVGQATQMPWVRETLGSYFTPRIAGPVQLAADAIAIGATIWADVLGGRAGSSTDAEPSGVGHPVMYDVTPHSIGVQLHGGEMKTIIPRNTLILPTTKRTMAFTSTMENQSSMLFRVFEGEARVAAQNNLVGEFTLDGLHPMASGTQEIELTFGTGMDSHLVVEAFAEEKLPLEEATNKRPRATAEE